MNEKTTLLVSAMLFAAVDSTAAPPTIGGCPVFPADNYWDIFTRGQVRTGNDIMIGGFVIQGAAPQTVVIRARGPSLAAFGIANALPNPYLLLFQSQTLLGSNDDWGSAANAGEISASGFAPANGLEAAMLVTLPPGAYTAIVTPGTAGPGVGIVEVFRQ